MTVSGGIIRRAARDSHFTVLPNAVLEDPEISFRALGLLTYILSKPDDWSINADRLARTHAEGRDAVRTAMTELELWGYVVRSRKRVGGRYASETVVYDQPVNREGSSPQRETSAGSPVRKNRIGEPGVSTSTETKNSHQEVPTTPRPRREVASDFDSSSAEGPALGADPHKHEEAAAPAKKKLKRKTGDARTMEEAKKRERIERAAVNGTTAFGQASRLFLGLEGKGYPDGVNVPAVARQMNSWLLMDGVSLATLEGMVDVFVASPERYMAKDAIPWRAFINARQKLMVDGGKTVALARPKKRVSRYAHQED